jgi:hypothetical protein
MNTHLSNLMQKEVSRKEFLGLVGLAVLSLFGFDTIIKLLTSKSSEHSANIGSETRPYGSKS